MPSATRSIQRGPIKIGSADYFADTLATMKGLIGRTIVGFAVRSNTVIGAVATNAKMSKEEANKVAQMTHAGLARTIRPAHTMLDGDTLFALATGERSADVNIVGAFAAEVMALAIVRAVVTAKSAGHLPGLAGA